MAIPPSGTFDYVAIVPDNPQEQASSWCATLRKDSLWTGERLVGSSPRLQITDAGIPTDTPPPTIDGVVRPRVFRARISLTATERTHRFASRVSFHVDRGLASALRTGDELNLTRTACGGLAISVVRGDQLIAAAGAVGSVPLGRDVYAGVPMDLVEEATAVFQRRDPEFELCELPIEVRVRDEISVLFRGTHRINGYEVCMLHGFNRGIPGRDECVAIALKGACPDTAANASALLLGFENALTIET